MSNLSMHVLLLLSTVTRWSDSRLTSLNPSLSLPNVVITLVLPKVASDCTFGVLEILGSVNASFASQFPVNSTWLQSSLYMTPNILWVNNDDDVISAIMTYDHTFGFAPGVG
jgi:hypothetical protein